MLKLTVMKKIYFFLLPLVCLFFSRCSKDFLKRYDERVIGSWYISDVNKIGLGGSFEELAFRQGTFDFRRDGSFIYTDVSGGEYNGTWDIQKRNINGENIRTLQITAIDFGSQRVLGEFYDDMQFRGTNHFVATIKTTFRSFVTHFRR